MEDTLIKLLETFGYPVIRQGSLGENEDYPKVFFTFWDNMEVEHSAYDNATTSVVYDFDVNIYADNPTKVYDLSRQARELLKTNGWQAPDRGHDIGSDVETHTGRGFNVTYITREN